MWKTSAMPKVRTLSPLNLAKELQFSFGENSTNIWYCYPNSWAVRYTCISLPTVIEKHKEDITNDYFLCTSKDFRIYM